MSRKNVCGIYKITSPSGKCYIGSSANIHKRINEHRGHFQRGDHYNQKLRNAAQKYGVDAMRFETVLVCEREALRGIEQLAIDHIDPEYNIERTVAKVLLDFWKCPTWRKKNSERCSEQNRSRWADPDLREKQVEHIKAMNARPEIKAALAERMKANWADDEFAAKMRSVSGANMRALHDDPAFRALHAERQRAVLIERCKDKDFCRRRDEAAAARNRRPLVCDTTGEFFGSVKEAAEAKACSISLVAKQIAGIPTRTGLRWRLPTDEELIERGYDPSRIRRDKPVKNLSGAAHG